MSSLQLDMARLHGFRLASRSCAMTASEASEPTDSPLCLSSPIGAKIGEKGPIWPTPTPSPD
ncbi:hypothetical protein IFHNHDMJ_02244 [Synechococcus sp. CBW1107]|nr:hypothetical protein IFHNHDMJ_02244 [Synechococcus sp. CBW1107]